MLGIPTHLAPRVNAWSLIRGFHTAAIGSLIVAATIVGVFASASPSPGLLSVIGAIVLTAIAVVVHMRRHSPTSAVVLLAVGGLAAWWALFVLQQHVSAPNVLSAVASLLTIPLVLVGGASTTTSRVVAWSMLGFLVGRLTTTVGAMQAGGPAPEAILGWVTLALTIGVIVASGRTGGRAAHVQPELLRAARDEHVSAYRHRIELEAAALLHDTVLSHLNAIAVTPRGLLDPGLTKTIDEDFAMLTGQDWLRGERPTSTVPESGQSSARFQRMIDSYRTVDSAGMRFEVRVSGDLQVLDSLDDSVVTALLGAVGQCLANVRNHADTDEAEVNVFHDGRHCTVMVVDDGRGFDQSETSPDRLGLKNSVQQRVERVGGEMQLWSAPGSGTSVMLSVPLPQRVEQNS